MVRLAAAFKTQCETFRDQTKRLIGHELNEATFLAHQQRQNPRNAGVSWLNQR